MLAAVHGHVVALGGAVVDLSGPPDALGRVGDHLAVLGDPARQAPQGEQGREHLRGEAHRLVDEAGVEVDVRVEAARDEVLVAQRRLLQLHGDLELAVAVVGAQAGQDVVGGLLDDGGARVVVLVDPVAEAHEPHSVLLVLDLADELGCGHPRALDGVQHP